MAFSFKDIIAWQKAYEFVLLVYKATNKFPDFEKHGLSCYVMLSKDLRYITEEEYQSLTFSVDGTSYYLNAYCKAIKDDKGIKD